MIKHKQTRKQRLHAYLFPEEVAKRERLIQIYLEGAHLPTDIQRQRMVESSGDLFNRLVTSDDYIQTLEDYSDADRLRDIEFNYQMYYTNGTFSGVTDRNLDYGLGKRVKITSSTDEEIITEALTAVRNTPILGVKNFRLLGLDFTMQGEMMFVVWYSELTKLSTISRIPTQDMKIIWADELTKLVPALYILKTADGDVLYRDWRTVDETVDKYLAENESVIYANDLESNVLDLQHVCVWSVGSKRHHKSGRGQPLLNNITKNSLYMSQFDDQRFAISSRGATYTEDFGVDGTNTDLSDFINREADVAPYGSAFVGNSAVNREWNNNPTGINSERFNQHVWYQPIASSTGQNHAMGGIPSALSNRSVLDKLMEIFIEYIETMQNTIADTIRDVFVVVVLVSKNPQLIGTPELLLGTLDTDINVTLDTPVNIDIKLAMEFILQQRAKEQITPEEEVRIASLETTIYNKFGIA